ncbi:metal transporter CNNM2-like [Dendronephthya gigantea]|uniref:metal transporter CNNM2-like n=1 Tax=Dendronephthya gigantea TaxID=151771 RepID=UPI00106A2B33|nr:metal transporter CNNM2-like [Dendronephthya gigantea]
MAKTSALLRFFERYFIVFIVFLISGIHYVNCSQIRPQLIAVYPSETGVDTKVSGGVVEVTSEKTTRLFFIGLNLSKNTSIVFTPTGAERGHSCDSFHRSRAYRLSEGSSGIFESEVTFGEKDSGKFYTCLLDGQVSSKWYHAGTDDTVTIKVTAIKTSLPIWLQVCLLVLLLALSGLFSGLNLGLMALDPTELKVVTNCGSPKEQKYAKKILPVRQHGNYLLCTLLLGNVLVNSSLTILLDALAGSGVIAVVASTAGIVIFGEIVPQSICSRHGLAIGSRTLFLTKFFMLITFPASFPISKLLDFILGEELGTIYNRKQLLEMIKVTAEHNDLAGDEMNIISGVLNYKSKCVEEIMTKIDSCFMLDVECHLDFATITTIMESGHSRIPVYRGERHNIVGLLFVKDLAFVDPDDCIPLQTVIKFYSRSVNFVWNDMNLGDLLDTFKEKHSHIAIVQKVNNEGPGDPFYQAIGLATLEDVIEEMIQSEIVDETDKYIDNTTFTANPQRRLTASFNMFVTEENVKMALSPQLQLASFQYLSTVVDAFSEDKITANVLKQMLKRKDVVLDIKIKDAPKESLVLYEKGKSVDYFMMIVQGRVDVTVGMEEFRFPQGAFSFFCQDVLLARNNSVYVPDYTVRVVEDCLIIKVSSAIYKQALISTKLKTWENDDDDEEFDLHVIYNDHVEHDVSGSNSTEPYTTPGPSPTTHRANKLNALI